VNETAQRVRADQSEQPRNQKNHENSPKHGCLLSSTLAAAEESNGRARTGLNEKPMISGYL
jgi:hypothetical protein